jgi:RNA polymerase sigma-70 factor (sigma-E family)
MADEEFRVFVEQRYATLLRTAYLLTGAPDAAEDLLQSALLATMSRWRAMDHPEAYVRQVMANQLVSRWRRRHVIEVLTAVLPERPGPPVSSPELRDELWQALRRLPARMRAVLVLRYWEDLSEAQTAEALGCSVGSVKSQASRSLARLRELVTPAALAASAAPNSGGPR